MIITPNHIGHNVSYDLSGQDRTVGRRVTGICFDITITYRAYRR